MSFQGPKELLSETIFRKLRSDIITGRLKPGERLVEMEIAKQFQSSQSPVREAFRRLEEQGLLKIVKHTGTFITEISVEEIQELFELRNLIEKKALKAAMYRMDSDDLQMLDDIVSMMKEAAEQNQLDRVIEADLQFHQTIIELSGKLTALRMWKLLDGQVRRFLMISHRKHFSNLLEVVETHQKLLAIIKSGQSHEVDQAVEEHILLIWNKINKIEL